MPTIHLETFILADTHEVFDLARSIDLHIVSTKQTNERAVAGKTSGLIELNETVTWQAKHFGIVQKLTTQITEYQKPDYFVDEQLSGAFKSFKHEHRFEAKDGGTLMTDVFQYVSPLGFLGKLADRIILKKYMESLLRLRNEVIREHAERH
ncbi:SRPBCC family protein [Pedobacter metabolipauper]|uniref:Ligand-binding SRPBCC domain-containing protein n=1 Tax=Pedobacter metabolipauper TaxID=425513 RepID=A0A4R6T277_9SPHI|nr:SRPBCC family protein [Pedobacter metabolipauper]TDQ11431.1 hypothetical protein ATK78_0553 [Pedobacter metabolipauper]